LKQPHVNNCISLQPTADVCSNSYLGLQKHGFTLQRLTRNNPFTLIRILNTDSI